MTTVVTQINPSIICGRCLIKAIFGKRAMLPSKPPPPWLNVTPVCSARQAPVELPALLQPQRRSYPGPSPLQRPASDPCPRRLTCILSPCPGFLNQVVEHLALGEGDRVLDCTCGAGGHAQALLDRGATVWGVDRDPSARAWSSERLQAYGERFRILAGTFATIGEQLVPQGERFDGVLADLGVSSMQLDEDERGFGIRSQADADMRMGDEASQMPSPSSTPRQKMNSPRSSAPTAKSAWQAELLGYLKEARAAGKRSAADLAAAVRSVIPGRQGRHPALRTFQALRIAVNGELDQLNELFANS